MTETTDYNPSPEGTNPAFSAHHIGQLEAGMPAKKDHIQMVWMISFADLLSILLVFFVLMYSLQATPPHKVEEIKKSIALRFNPNEVPRLESTPGELTISRTSEINAQPLTYLAAILQPRLAAIPALRDIPLRQEGDRVIISLKTGMLFAQGSMNINKEGEAIMLQLAGALNVFDNHVDIVGTSDAGFVASNAIPSRWEFSMQRAEALSRALAAGEFSKKIQVYGRGMATDTIEIIIRERQAK